MLLTPFKRPVIATAIALMIAPAVIGQHYEAQTLDFNNVTSDNVMAIAETQGGSLEKEVEFGDIDNDGDMDCVIAVAVGAFGQRYNKLYINDGGVLNEVSDDTDIIDEGFRYIPEGGDVSRNVFLRDYDGDGWLDLIVVNDSNDGTTTWNSSGRTKYFSNQPSGTAFGRKFVNETGRLNGATGAACSGFSTDINNDGTIDLFMANYPFTSQDTMYFNGIGGQPLGNFTDMTSTHVRSESDYAVDSVFGDLNGDGKKDLVVGSTTGDDNFIIYNDNLGNGEGIGDFKYSGNTNHTRFPSTSFWPAYEISDFDNDGMNDLLYVNKGGHGSSGTDVIMRNLGNDSNNKATFEDFPLPTAVASDSRKATVVDLDGNGLDDILIMSRSRRPYIYRNMSTPGNLKFIEWTPRDAFPANALYGWHTGAADVNNDDRTDLLVGGHSGEHLFHNELPTQYAEDSLSGTLPAFHNSSPVCVLGTGNKLADDTYTASGIPSGATVSVILRSFSDTKLEVYNSSGGLIASSDDGLAHVGEAVQFTAPGGDIEIRVKMIQISGDVNDDGVVNLTDSRLLRGFFFSRAPEAMIVDFDANGIITLIDARLFRSRFSIGPAKDGYVLEVNSRSN